MNKSKILKVILENDTRVTKAPKIGDFSNVEQIEGVSFEELIPISFNNLVCLFISQVQLREKGIEHLEDLIGKSVTYGILLPNGSLLFGHTSDVGERFHTYTKDARSKETKFFKDLRDYGRGLVIIFKVCNKEDSKYWEKRLIEGYKKAIFEAKISADICEYTDNEVNEIVGDYIYNIHNY